jgi:hypothetical protein
MAKFKARKSRGVRRTTVRRSDFEMQRNAEIGLFEAARNCRLRATIIHLWAAVARRLQRPTRELGRAVLKRSPIWSCTGWGLQSIPGHPGTWCALTAPFHPYRPRREDFPPAAGGMLSVALSFASPRLHVMEHPALRCSDFPPGRSCGPAIVWTTSTAFVLPFGLNDKK